MSDLNEFLVDCSGDGDLFVTHTVCGDPLDLTDSDEPDTLARLVALAEEHPCVYILGVCRNCGQERLGVTWISTSWDASKGQVAQSEEHTCRQCEEALAQARETQ